MTKETLGLSMLMASQFFDSEESARFGTSETYSLAYCHLIATHARVGRTNIYWRFQNLFLGMVPFLHNLDIVCLDLVELIERFHLENAFEWSL
jgi:hypothetical protein